MAFWSDTTLEPKRQFKFQVRFSWLDVRNTLSESTFLAQSADRPVYTISDSQKVHYLDKEFTFPGKITWAPVKITFVDAHDTSTGGIINVSSRSYEYLNHAGWLRPNQIAPANVATASSRTTINKGSANNGGAGDVQIKVLSSDGATVDYWVLKNAFVTTVALNELNYAQEGILTAQYTFRYDWAEYNIP